MSKAVFSPTRLIATVAALLLLLPASAQWNNIAPTNGGSSIKFVSSTTGYLQSFNDMRKTTDGGVTWASIDAVSGSLSCEGMYWLNANDGFAVFSENLGWGNYAGWFKKTTNGGASWTTIQQVSSSEALYNVWFTSATTGYVIGGGGLIRKTTNGGSTWTTLSSSTTLDLYAIQFVNATTGYIGGDDGIILKTINSGSSWSQQFSSIYYEFTDVEFTDPLNGCITGTYGIMRTTNGGVNWTPVTVYGTYQFSQLDFPSADTGYMSGIGGNVFRTIDGGATWLGLNSISPAGFVRDVDFISNDTGFAVTDFSGTWKTSNAGSGCPTLLVQNTVSMPDTIHACAGTYGIFTASASALNNYPINVSPAWVLDTAMSYGQYFYVQDSIANDTLQITITMTDPFTGCGMLTDMMVLITDSTSYVPLSQPTNLYLLCPGDSVALDMGPNAEEGYFWQMSMDSTQTLTVDTTGVWFGTAYACGTQYGYVFVVQWDTNCSVQSACSVYAGPDTTFCQQQGQLSATPSTPGNYSYVWTPATGLDNPYSATPNVVTGVSNQQYVVTMTDLNNGCSSTDTVVVSAYYFNTMSDTINLCTSVVLNLGPGGTNYLFQTFTDTLGNTTVLNQTVQSISVSQPGTYVGYATFPGCGTLTSVFNVVANCDTCGVYAGPDTTFCQQMGQLFAQPQIPGLYSYQWSPATGLNNPNIQSPLVVSGVHNQQYVVTMTDLQGGCVAQDTVVVSAYYFHVQDTTFICNGSPAVLDFGPGGTNYIWQFYTDTAGNTTLLNIPAQQLTVTQPGTYSGIGIFPNCGALTSVFTVVDSCNVYVANVWPGDCNYDLIVNMADALHIGLGYGATDAVRPGATNAWYAQPMVDWSQNYVNCNYKHGDADGNGVIDINDTLPVSLNYSLTHPFRYGQPVAPAVAPSLELVCSVDTVGLQTLVQIDVVLGTNALPMDSLYGISFRITSEAGLIDTTLTAINANSSWLGTNGSDMFAFQKHFPSAAVVDFAEVKNNHVNTNNGTGVIASFYIVTTDNLSGIAICNFDLSDVTCVTESQTYITLGVVNDSVVIDPTVMPGFAEADQPVEFRMYPNPANENVTIHTTFSTDVIEICDMTGRVVQSIVPNGNNTVIQTSGLSEGMYLVNVKNGSGVVTQKLTISR